MKLNNEDIKFIKELSFEIKNQDTRGTAQPYGLIIGKKERQISDERFADRLAIHYGDSDFDDLDELRDFFEECEHDEALEILNERCKYLYDVAIYENELNEVLCEKLTAYYYNLEDTFNPNIHCIGNFFLTDKGAKKYIEDNKHNLGNSAFTYGIHLYRNNEMKKLIEIIHKIADSIQE